MTLTLRSIAALAFAVAALSGLPALAAQNNGVSEGSVPDVCLTAWELCSAGCNAANPDSGLNFNEYISNQVCQRQCVDSLNACIATGGDGSGSPARKQSVRKHKVAGFDFKGNGTPNDTPQQPAGGTGQPADPSGGKSDPGGGKGGFNPGAVFNGPATVLIQ